MLAHPSALNAARTTLPESRRRVEPEPGPEVEPLTELDQISDEPPSIDDSTESDPPMEAVEPIEIEPVYEDLMPLAGSVRQVRESDGLEPILRLAAAWQRIDEGAIRQTQQGTYFKRDRERLEDDLVLAGPIADAIEPLPDMPLLWVALARAVGVVHPEAGTDRLVAADPEFWGDNAVHLPQMIATKWLALRDWHEQLGMVEPDPVTELSLPYLRIPALLWLATVPDDAWVALDDLATLWDTLAPGWDRPILHEAGRIDLPGGAEALGAILLGPAYQLGLVRTAEESSDGRRVRAVDSPGPLRPGGWVAADPSDDLRPLPPGAAQLRDDRLPARADPQPDRPVQPVRPLDAGGRGAGVEVDPRLGLSRPRRGPDDAGDARPLDSPQRPPLARRRRRGDANLGPIAATG